MTNISTKTIPNWCAGCFNFQILAGVKKVLSENIKTEADRKNWAIVTGIGCHAKMFDYLNLNGLNTLHGRVLPTCLGLKIAEPKLNVLGFSGDGKAAEAWRARCCFGLQSVATRQCRGSVSADLPAPGRGSCCCWHGACRPIRLSRNECGAIPDWSGAGASGCCRWIHRGAASTIGRRTDGCAAVNSLRMFEAS